MPATGDEEICLGIVITIAHKEQSTAIEQLKDIGSLELGTIQDHRMPASIITKRGLDREVIAAIEALPAVLRVDIAFAQVIEEEVA